MTALRHIMAMVLRSERRAFAQGLVLSLAVLAMGIALLALSGWFITAAAAAGLVGLGTVFNVFAPSAMVRFLALGRTAARYGERLTTHDATLRALSGLRVRLLAGRLHAPYRQLERLRASVFLNRVTADIDALDGLALRLLLPGLAGLAVIGMTAAALAWLVHPLLAYVVLLGYGAVPSAIFLFGQRRARQPGRRAEAGSRALRSRLIDMIAVRDDLIAFGQMVRAASDVTRAAGYQSAGQAAVDRIERQTGFWLDVAGWGSVALTLGIGASLAQSGQISPAQAAIGVFAALALSEAVAPVRRALSEIGRMRSAARRVVPLLDGDAASASLPRCAGQTTPLVLHGVTAKRGSQAMAVFAPVQCRVGAGETVALTGRSGCGKSTVLLIAAGQIAPDSGHVSYGETCQDPALTGAIAMVPQRHALVAGTVAENLRLAAPTAPDDALWEALQAVELADTVRAKGGLSARLGFRGAGLSGGESRRLVLARALLVRPQILLLDEPTEGLDGAMAARVLNRMRDTLPDAAILMAAHRPEEVVFAHRIVPLAAPDGAEVK